jgi:antitoxin (DNA-binding transcriptional repressor) of toxin-antitoxin stability system
MKSMRTVNIGQLKNQLSAYLQLVRNGEEVVVRDRDLPVARIVPYKGSLSDEEAQLVASGAMTVPEQEIDWELFWSRPKANVPHDVAVQAVIDSRGDR